MPPQVSGAGPGRGPVVQNRSKINETKSGDVEKKPSQEPQNVTQNNTPHCASPKEKSQKNLEVAIGCSTQKIELNEKMKAKEGKTSTPKSTEEAKQVDSSMGMLQQTMGNALKSIGDGLSSVAKK